jgi:hypothetical protein
MGGGGGEGVHRIFTGLMGSMNLIAACTRRGMGWEEGWGEAERAQCKLLSRHVEVCAFLGTGVDTWNGGTPTVPAPHATHPPRPRGGPQPQGHVPPVSLGEVAPGLGGELETGKGGGKQPRYKTLPRAPSRAMEWRHENGYCHSIELGQCMEESTGGSSARPPCWKVGMAVASGVVDGAGRRRCKETVARWQFGKPPSAKNDLSPPYREAPPTNCIQNKGEGRGEAIRSWRHPCAGAEHGACGGQTPVTPPTMSPK